MIIKPLAFFSTACAAIVLVSSAAFAADKPAPIEPPIIPPTPPTQQPGATPNLTLPPLPGQAPAPAPAPAAATPAPTPPASIDATLGGTAAPSRNVNDFQDEEIGNVIRALARQAGIGVVISPKVAGKITLRLENKTPMQTLDAVCKSSNLFLDHDTQTDVYFVRTQEEKAKEPTESAFYTFSYAKAKDAATLLATQLQSKEVPPQVDERTNTVFYREAKSNIDKIALFLRTIDRPTQQVMIEARLVEVTANPQQGYGFNWAGVLGGATAGSEKKFTYGGSGNPLSGANGSSSSSSGASGSTIPTTDFAFHPRSSNLFRGVGSLVAPQFAILSAPEMSLTMRLLNQDADAEFLANPRIVTANNQKATIKIIRNQPVPNLNFNEQTATAVFSGFQDKEFGNTLDVTPSINKDNFITMSVKPEISNKVADATFTFAGAAVTSPVIDKRTLESNVLIKSGDTLAIGGLLQDEVSKTRAKVPVAGDIPLIGNIFQEHVNARTKRNLLVFVTPTIISQGYGTGLEDQVSGLHHSGEEFADPNGWRNNAKGSIRLIPTSNRQVASDYPKPGIAPAPDKIKYKISADERDK